MVNDSCLEQKNFIPKKRRKGGRGRIKRKKIIKAKRRSVFFNIIFLIAIVITALITAFNFYISINCKDLSFAVEYYCTHGFSSKDKLLRVQTISLINCDNDTAVVEAQGLSKSMPHKSISIKGNFKKGIGSSWYLESISQF